MTHLRNSDVFLQAILRTISQSLLRLERLRRTQETVQIEHMELNRQSVMILCGALVAGAIIVCFEGFAGYSSNF